MLQQCHAWYAAPKNVLEKHSSTEKAERCHVTSYTQRTAPSSTELGRCWELIFSWKQASYSCFWFFYAWAVWKPLIAVTVLLVRLPSSSGWVSEWVSNCADVPLRNYSLTHSLTRNWTLLLIHPCTYHLITVLTFNLTIYYSVDVSLQT